jgi:G3E family GTPase
MNLEYRFVKIILLIYITIIMIPITILTGFLGSGKTTILNKIIDHNPNKKFGLIINEFGEVGIDGQLVEDSGQELVELSNGCMCCVVRSDLYTTVEKLINTGKVDYILIEASGLAEPQPIADTFVMNNLENRTSLDSIVCLVDVENYQVSEKSYKVAIEQLQFCDIILLNKVNDKNQNKVGEIKILINKINPAAIVLINDDELDTQILIETGKWTEERLAEYKLEEEHEDKHEHEHEHEHEHHHDHNESSEHDHHHHKHEHHHHEHDEVDEVVFVTKENQLLDPNKLDNWLKNQFPSNCVRAKGLLNLPTINKETGCFLFQMVGASKILTPFQTKRQDVNLKFSRMVLIGKKLNKEEILTNLNACIYEE